MTFAEIMNAKIAEQKEIVNKAETEKRALTEEEQTSFNNLQSEIENIENSLKIAKSIKPTQDVEPKNLIEVKPLNKEPNNEEITVDSEEYKNAWLKYTQNPANATQNADIMNVIYKVNPVNATTSDTGLFVPTTIANDIYSLMLEQHPILSDVRVMDIKGNFTMNIHTGITANDAKSIPVGQCLDPEENTFASVTLKGFQYGKLVEIPWAMRAMNISAWESYLREEIAARLGSKLANDVFYGAGEAILEMTGVDPTVKAKEPTQVKTYTTLSYEDLTWAMAKTALPTGQRYIYVNEETYWAVLSNMVDGNKRPLFIADPATGVFRSVFGFEVKIESAVKASDIWVGKPYVGYLMNYNQRITTVTDDEPKCLKTNIVGWCVVDGVPVTTKAWALLTKEAGFTGLMAAAPTRTKTTE